MQQSGVLLKPALLASSCSKSTLFSCLRHECRLRPQNFISLSLLPRLYLLPIDLLISPSLSSIIASQIFYFANAFECIYTDLVMHVRDDVHAEDVKEESEDRLLRIVLKLGF